MRGSEAGFGDLGLHQSLLSGLKELGFVRPTPIQREGIPAAIAGRDLLATAMTGSGKTAAFLLPILNALIGQPRRVSRALVLTPTRELAAQIVEEANSLSVHTPVTAAAIYGGVGMGPQEHAFRSGVDVLVATPGRLLDHFRFPYAKLDALQWLVLDEADRMLDMGFLPEIRRVLKHLPSKRQTLFFSATMPPEIARLASEMLRDPLPIHLQRSTGPAVGITQAIYPVPQELKSQLLITLVQRGDIFSALVFTRTKHRADRLAKHLQRAGLRAERIHGNRSQAQRTEALAGFKSGKYQLLVATDIAARGIDVEALRHVVNFDVPAAPEDYVHRVGRTGRAEETGDAFTFVARDEEALLRAIEKAIGKRLPRVTVPDFDYNAKSEAALEVPLAERIAKIRAEKQKARQRQAEKAADKQRLHQRQGEKAPGKPKGERPPTSAAQRPATRPGSRPHPLGRPSGQRPNATSGQRPSASAGQRPGGSPAGTAPRTSPGAGIRSKPGPKAGRPRRFRPN